MTYRPVLDVGAADGSRLPRPVRLVVRSRLILVVFEKDISMAPKHLGVAPGLLFSTGLAAESLVQVKNQSVDGLHFVA